MGYLRSSSVLYGLLSKMGSDAIEKSGRRGNTRCISAAAQNYSRASIVMELILPPFYQVGFVVDDIEKSIADYQPLFGPFETMDANVEGANFRGSEHKYSLKLAFGYSGETQVELIQWCSGMTPHKEFLDKGRTGMHHLGFDVRDVDASIEDGLRKGYELVWYHAFSASMKYAYLERAGDDLIIELTQGIWHGKP